VFLPSNSCNARLVNQIFSKLSQNTASGLDPLGWLTFCFLNTGCNVSFG